MSEQYETVRQHLRHFFAGHPCEEKIWTDGPRYEEIPRLSVLEFAPGRRSEQCWIYATLGGHEFSSNPKLEFVLAASEQKYRHVQLITMVAWYHKRYTLGTGHTMPIGEPWLPDSRLDHYLVSTPYPFGDDLEYCNLADGHIHVLWLLPITKQEREFKAEQGLEALEQLFEDASIEYGNPYRDSVV